MTPELSFESVEFDCCECGRHIARIVGCGSRAAGQPEFCGVCLTVPGWFRDPDLRAALDPEGYANPPEERL